MKRSKKGGRPELNQVQLFYSYKPFPYFSFGYSIGNNQIIIRNAYVQLLRVRITGRIDFYLVIVQRVSTRALSRDPANRPAFNKIPILLKIYIVLVWGRNSRPLKITSISIAIISFQNLPFTDEFLVKAFFFTGEIGKGN